MVIVFWLKQPNSYQSLTAISLVVVVRNKSYTCISKLCLLSLLCFFNLAFKFSVWSILHNKTKKNFVGLNYFNEISIFLSFCMGFSLYGFCLFFFSFLSFSISENIISSFKIRIFEYEECSRKTELLLIYRFIDSFRLYSIIIYLILMLWIVMSLISPMIRILYVFVKLKVCILDSIHLWLCYVVLYRYSRKSKDAKQCDKTMLQFSTSSLGELVPPLFL